MPSRIRSTLSAARIPAASSIDRRAHPGHPSMNYPNLAGTNVIPRRSRFASSRRPTSSRAMHNEVRVDPLNQIARSQRKQQPRFPEHRGHNRRRLHERRLQRVDASPRFRQSPDPTNTVSRNAVVTYVVKVRQRRHRSGRRVRCATSLPAGAAYIEATGTNSFLCQQQLVGLHRLRRRPDCRQHTPRRPGATITIKVFAPDTPGTYTNQVDRRSAIRDRGRQRVQQQARARAD